MGVGGHCGGRGDEGWFGGGASAGHRASERVCEGKESNLEEHLDTALMYVSYTRHIRRMLAKS